MTSLASFETLSISRSFWVLLFKMSAKFLGPALRCGLFFHDHVKFVFVLSVYDKRWIHIPVV